MGAGGVKPSLPFYFIKSGGKTVNTQKCRSHLPFSVNTGFSETFLFSEITFQKKENTHIP